MYIEYDRSTSSRGIPHADRIFSNDKNEMVLRLEQRLQELGLIWGWMVTHQKLSDELSLSDKIKMLEPCVILHDKNLILETVSD